MPTGPNRHRSRKSVIAACRCCRIAALAARHDVADQPAQDVGRTRRVVPHLADRMIERQCGGVRGVARAAVAEQHLDAVGGLFVDVVLDEPQTRPHLQQVEHRDRLPVGADPLGHRGGGADVEQTVGDEDPDRRVRDRLGHAPRHEGRVGIDGTGRLEHVRRLGAVPLGDDLTALLDDEREGRSLAVGTFEHRLDQVARHLGRVGRLKVDRSLESHEVTLASQKSWCPTRSAASPVNPSTSCTSTSRSASSTTGASPASSTRAASSWRSASARPRRSWYQAT